MSAIPVCPLCDGTGSLSDGTFCPHLANGQQAAPRTATAYDALIDELADLRPFGYRHDGDVILTREQLAIVLTNSDVRDNIANDEHLVSHLIDDFSPAYETEDHEASAFRTYSILQRTLMSYAQAQVFEDVRYLLVKRDDEEAQDDDRIDRAREVRQEAVFSL